jgi:hypothetical protein
MHTQLANKKNTFDSSARLCKPPCQFSRIIALHYFEKLSEKAIVRNGVDCLNSHVRICGECDERLARAAVLFDLLRSSIGKLDVDALQLFIKAD